jgi:hypothetical protein
VKKITLTLFPVLISLLFIFPIVKESWSSFILILLFLNVLLYKLSIKEYCFIEPKTLLLTIPFWIILFRSLFSHDIQQNSTHIQHGLIFLIVPVCFSLIPISFFNKQKLDLYISILKNTCFFMAIVYVIGFFSDKSFYELFIVFQNVSSFRNYVYTDFKLFVIHPTYYSTILILCSAHSFNRVLNKKKYFELWYVFVFLLISFFLLTRLNVVLIVLLLITMILLEKTLVPRYKIIFSAVFITLATLLTLFTPGIKHRFVEIYVSFNKPPVGMDYDSTNIRKAIFNCCIELSKEKPILGIGFENLQNNLNACYAANYDSSFYESITYMTHNYFFYIFLSSGLIGLCLFSIYLVNILNIARKSKIFLFNVFLFNALIVCFFEDYLYRHYGVLYFNLLLMCFIQYSKSESSNSIDISG